MNNNNIEQKTFETIAGPLEKLKESAQKMKEKRELKRWNEISFPFTIKDALLRLSKDELSDIRKCLEIKGASQLKKGELIDLLSIEIPLLLENICMNMDQERFFLIKNVIGNGGYIEDPELTGSQLKYFRDFGLLFTGTYRDKKIAAVPEEIMKNPFMQEFFNGDTSQDVPINEQKSLLKIPDRKEIEQFTNKKIGRNAPCPCGSGKKFKKCCGK